MLEDDGAILRADYAEVRRDAYGLGRATFDVIAGADDLRGRDDFLARVAARGSGQARLRLPRLGGDDLRVLFFVDPPGGAATTLVLHAVAPADAAEASPSARLLGGPDDDAREEAVALLARVAAAIGADYFFAGPSLVEWRRVPVSRLLGGPNDDFEPILVAWRGGLFARQQLARAWGVDVDAVDRTARGFERVWV